MLQVLRQVAIAEGLGRKRPRPKRELVPRIGAEGEDVLPDPSGNLKLRMPARLATGSVKAAAWQV